MWSDTSAVKLNPGRLRGFPEPEPDFCAVNIKKYWKNPASVTVWLASRARLIHDCLRPIPTCWNMSADILFSFRRITAFTNISHVHWFTCSRFPTLGNGWHSEHILPTGKLQSAFWWINYATTTFVTRLNFFVIFFCFHLTDVINADTTNQWTYNIADNYCPTNKLVALFVSCLKSVYLRDLLLSCLM